MRLLYLLGIATAGLIASVSVASASTVTFFTPAGSTTGGGPVNAEATFTTGAGSLSVTLTNLEANITDVAQALSDLVFTIPGVSPAASLTSGSGQEITIAGNGTPTLGSTAPAGWVFSTSGDVVTLDVLSGPGHAGPAHTIIGPPGPGDVYSNANGSIAGNGPHNPFLNQMATFTITDAAITAATTVTAATFSFGTTAGINVPGEIPVPAALPLFATGLGALGLLGWRRRRKAAA
jgi:hypothetical protein